MDIIDVHGVFIDFSVVFFTVLLMDFHGFSIVFHWFVVF